MLEQKKNGQNLESLIEFVLRNITLSRSSSNWCWVQKSEIVHLKWNYRIKIAGREFMKIDWVAMEEEISILLNLWLRLGDSTLLSFIESAILFMLLPTPNNIIHLPLCAGISLLMFPSQAAYHSAKGLRSVEKEFLCTWRIIFFTKFSILWHLQEKRLYNFDRSLLAEFWY